ncbi:MAG: AsmA family protein [Arenicellales bacterium]
MTSGKIFTIIFRVIVIPVALIGTLIAILSYANISVPLEVARKQFVSKATDAVGHDVRIDGEVRLAISFFPTLVVDQLHISNAPQWSAKDILRIGEARVQLALLPILSGRFEFVEISASAVQVNLEQASDGSQNWATLFKSNNKTEQPDGSSVNKSATSRNSEQEKGRIWIEEFSLSDINVHYVDETLKRDFKNSIDKLVIYTHEKDHLTASIQGNTQDIPYFFTAKSDLLRNLISQKPWNMELQGRIADKPLTLDIQLEFSKSLDGTISLNAQEVDAGKTLSWLGLVDGLDAFSHTLVLNAELKGGTLKEVLDQSTFKISMKEGYWNLQNPAHEASRKITYSTASLFAEPGKPIKLEFSGKIDNESLLLELTSNKLGEFFSTLDKIHLNLNADFTHTTINLDGDIDLPVSRETFRTDLVVNGKSLDKWKRLLQADIPPFGPYHLSGKFSVDAKGFRVNNLKTTIGSSDLSGEIFISTENENTHWDLDLVSQNFQIDDFSVEGFSLIPEGNVLLRTPVTPVPKNIMKENRQKASRQSFQVSHNYPGLDVNLQLKANKVLSGNDQLGGGKLQLRGDENSLFIDAFHLDLPGGVIDGGLELQLQDQGIKGRLKLNMDKFNYGILYRHYYPDSPADGLISTRVDLHLAGRNFKHGLEHASGIIDFAFWPGNIDASVINLWAVNLFLAILPELNKKESKFNCGVALLDIKDGNLSEELLLVDTSKIWMQGNLKINFQKEEVSLSLFPKAKKARLFGLQAPIRIKGNFTDLGLSIKPYDIVSSYISFMASPLTAPFQRIFSKKIPEDASSLCGELLDRDHLKEVLAEMSKNNPSLDDMYNND